MMFDGRAVDWQQRISVLPVCEALRRNVEALAAYRRGNGPARAADVAGAGRASGDRLGG